MSKRYDFIYEDEKAVFELRRLYESHGFSKFRVAKFEPYDFYARNRDFLTDNNIISFSDLNGRLLALKPDITLSIIKNHNPADKEIKKLYYTENVYRESKAIHEFREIFQVGLEVLGDIDLFITLEVICLALSSLELIDPDCKIELSHMGYISALLDSVPIEKSDRTHILELISQRNLHEIEKFVNEKKLGRDFFSAVDSVLKPGLSDEERLDNAYRSSFNDDMRSAVSELRQIYDLLKGSGLGDKVGIDFSDTRNPSYYNGVTVCGFVRDIPYKVLSGGRYDKMMKRLGKPDIGAFGFAIYFDVLDRKLHVKNSQEIGKVILYDNDSDTAIMLNLILDLEDQGITFVTVKCDNAETYQPDSVKSNTDTEIIRIVKKEIRRQPE